jgi:hypothetical protein
MDIRDFLSGPVNTTAGFTEAVATAVAAGLRQRGFTVTTDTVDDHRTLRIAILTLRTKISGVPFSFRQWSSPPDNHSIPWTGLIAPLRCAVLLR